MSAEGRGSSWTDAQRGATRHQRVHVQRVLTRLSHRTCTRPRKTRASRMSAFSLSPWTRRGVPRQRLHRAGARMFYCQTRSNGAQGALPFPLGAYQVTLQQPPSRHHVPSPGPLHDRVLSSPGSTTPTTSTHDLPLDVRHWTNVRPPSQRELRPNGSRTSIRAGVAEEDPAC
jgi:hypothetical protein